jgi:Cu-Zn family superoxide dismutase
MRPTLTIISAVLVLAACSQKSGSTSNAVVANMRDASGRELGTLTVADGASGLVTAGTLRGLTPGTHGIHLHTVGKCDPPFTSAGGHWNPTSRQHGFDNPLGPHGGDMRNISAADDGSATVYVNTPFGTLRGANAILDADGAAVVVHAAADDYRTDPSGNSGARIACGVLTPAP